MSYKFVRGVRTELNTFNNNWYNPGGSVKRTLWYVVNVLFFLNPLFPIQSVKLLLLRWFGAKVGDGVVLKPRVNIKYPWLLEIGDNTWIGENVWIDNLEKIIIGNNCCLSQGAVLLSGNHDYTKSSFDLIIKPIVLEDGVWIGANSMVTQGVICKSHSILAVGSVASSDMEEFKIYRGNPAVAVKDRITRS